MSRTPTIGEVLDRARDRMLKGCRVALPGTVQSYDPVTQTADVQPLIADLEEQEDGTMLPAPFPVLPHLPVIFPGAGGFRITFPVKTGDTGQILVNDLSLDLWRALGGPQAPLDRRRHWIADASFLPGLHPDVTPWTGASVTALTMGADAGPQVVCRAGGIELGGSDATPPTDAIALASLVLAQLNALKAVFTAWTPTGTLADATALKTALTALFTVGPGWPLPVASAIIKAQ